MHPFPTARDPLLSLLQSASAAFGRMRGRGHAHPLHRATGRLVASRRGPPRPYAPPAGGFASSEACAALGLDWLRAAASGDRARLAAETDRFRFSACDPLWAETLVDYARRFLPDGVARPIPYRRFRALGDFVRVAPRASLRVALLSDWGTGTAEARIVAALLARQRPDVVIHLGDIYYAGTETECVAHFLAPLRAALGPAVTLLALCGNHDVYSGGEGYYRLLDRIGQPASYVCLRAPDRSWQILGADTGLNDRDPFDVATALTAIDPAEERWHADKLDGFPGRTVFLTHHQPFSAFAPIGRAARHDPTNPNLVATHEHLARAGRIDAWFWGHEHSLRIYAPYRGVGAGRNIGYGAIPVAAVADPFATLPGLVDPPALAARPLLDVADGAYDHGFALLDLSPDGIDAFYWATRRPGAPIHRERLGRDGAAPTA